MKKLILLLTAILMVGCDQNPDGSYNTSKSFSFETIVIDSCEYVGGYYRLAHKGNCKYCQERIKKMIKEVKDE